MKATDRRRGKRGGAGFGSSGRRGSDRRGRERVDVGGEGGESDLLLAPRGDDRELRDLADASVRGRIEEERRAQKDRTFLASCAGSDVGTVRFADGKHRYATLRAERESPVKVKGAEMDGVSKEVFACLACSSTDKLGWLEGRRSSSKRPADRLGSPGSPEIPSTQAKYGKRDTLGLETARPQAQVSRTRPASELDRSPHGKPG